MEWMLVALLIIGAPIALTIWLIVRAISARNRIEELSHRLVEVESEIIRLKRERETSPKMETAPLLRQCLNQRLSFPLRLRLQHPP